MKTKLPSQDEIAYIIDLCLWLTLLTTSKVMKKEEVKPLLDAWEERCIEQAEQHSHFPHTWHGFRARKEILEGIKTDYGEILESLCETWRMERK